MDIIPGNHDVYYKNTNDLNSLNEILEQHDRITIYNEATVVSYDKLDILLLPGICEENHDRSIEAIKKSKATILAGHLELGGFEVMRGIKAIDGMDRKLFDRFDSKAFIVFFGLYTLASRSEVCGTYFSSLIVFAL